MKKVLAISLCLAVTSAFPQQQYNQQQRQQPAPQATPQQQPIRPTNPPVAILSLDNTVNHDGTYRYSFEGGDGTRAEQSGSLKTIGQEAGEISQGSYSYVGDDGKTYSLTYTADETGYHPVGDHLPQPPPTPEAILSYDTYPKIEWPQCPEEAPAPFRTVAHPYLKGIYFKEKPIVTPQSVKVTYDGRFAEFNRDKIYKYSDPPLNIPPWFRPRFKSVEIRGGNVYNGCECWRKNGLQDDCPRWDCQRPECLSRPLPECPPSNNPPFNGIRKPNAFML